MRLLWLTLAELTGKRECMLKRKLRSRQLRNLATRRYVPAIYEALIYTGLGNKDEAFRWMERAVEERTEYLVYLGVEPLADPLRNDPRFAELARRVSGKVH